MAVHKILWDAFALKKALLLSFLRLTLRQEGTWNKPFFFCCSCVHLLPNYFFEIALTYERLVAILWMCGTGGSTTRDLLRQGDLLWSAETQSRKFWNYRLTKCYEKMVAMQPLFLLVLIKKKGGVLL